MNIFMPAAALLAIALAVTVRAGLQSRPAPQPLWTDGAPGAKGTQAEDVPTLTPYLLPPDKATGAAVVVCPGGGYAGHAPHEAEPIARWLNSLGVTAFVLHYRLAPRYHHPAMLQDAQRALRTVRARAAEWGVDPRRVGILGFSAGGHLVSTASTHFDDGDPKAPDPVERAGCRPDAAILVYPVITMAGPYAHAGCRENLLGPEPPKALVESLCSEKQVTAKTPPTFLVHTHGDSVVPAENSLMYATALRKAGVPVELLLFEKGEHGFGLGGDDPTLSAWPKLCAAWLRTRGFVK